MLSSQLALLATLAAGVVGAPTVDTPVKIRFDGHQVVRCGVSPSAVDALRAIAVANPSLDWWTPPVRRPCMRTLRHVAWHPMIVIHPQAYALANDATTCTGVG